MNKPLLILDVDDIFIYANDIMKVKLSKEEAIKIYDGIGRGNWDCENSTFWSFIEIHVNDFIRERDNE